MKIGIITFHWATNYGAVLQAYALQRYLSLKGFCVKIINYYPLKYKHMIYVLQILHNMKVNKKIKVFCYLKELIKEKKIEKFRAKNLIRTKYYSSDMKLRKSNIDFDYVVCGSDQVWNESFVSGGERQESFVYFLDFIDNCKKISYAASFGANKITEKSKDKIKKFLDDFYAISVRESTGVDILCDIGLEDVHIVPDPTLLLKKEDYLKFVIPRSNNEKYSFVYMLHGIIDLAENYIRTNNCHICGNIGIEEWLSEIYYSEFVITNSFHGTVFSILFEKPFITYYVEGSEMNDRIDTLLDTLELKDRIYSGNEDVFKNEINWEAVREKLEKYRKTGMDFLSLLDSEEEKINED